MFGDDFDAVIGSFEKYCDKYAKDYNGLWDVTIPLMEHNE
jgi:hypothetical protein